MIISKPVYTEIVPFSAFYLAEGYHQKHYLKLSSKIAAEYERIYPDPKDFLNSIAVTKVNGYLGGYGNYKDLEKDPVSLGLSASSTKLLLDISKNALSLSNDGSVCPVPN